MDLNIVKCKNGHFFDSNTYSVCPTCGAEIAAGSHTHQRDDNKKKAQDKKTKEPKSSLFGLFGKKKEEAAEPQPQPVSQIRQESFMPKSQEIPRSEKKEEPEFSWEEAAKSQGGDTHSFWEEEIKKRQAQELFQQGTAESVQSISQHIPTTDSSYHQEYVPYSQSSVSQMQSMTPPVQEKPEIRSSMTPVQERVEVQNPAPVVQEAQNVSLQAQIRQASAMSEGKTMSYFSAMTAQPEKKAEVRISTDPVVGWLVCIAGKYFGSSFHISAGRNSIGRNDSNQISLHNDESISREKHAFIIYEPKKRRFYLQPGDSSGLTYLNDDYLTESKQLSSHDVIELGNSRFVFVPLCDERFFWENYIAKE